MTLLVLLAGVHLVLAFAGAAADERSLLLGGLVGYGVCVVLAVLLDLLRLTRARRAAKANPEVEGYADPFAEIEYLDWAFPPLVHEEDRAA